MFNSFICQETHFLQFNYNYDFHGTLNDLKLEISFYLPKKRSFIGIEKHAAQPAERSTRKID